MLGMMKWRQAAKPYQNVGIKVIQILFLVRSVCVCVEKTNRQKNARRLYLEEMLVGYIEKCCDVLFGLEYNRVSEEVKENFREDNDRKGNTLLDHCFLSDILFS
ncbi:hypothetical protein CHUAL_013276 [Chamberlinius hualienensis]